MSVEGLQALKPRSKAGDFHEETTGCNRVDTGMKTMESGGNIDGVNVEVCLVLSEDQSAEIDKWTVENIKFSVKQPVSYFSIVIVVVYCIILDLNLMILYAD